MTIIHHDKRSTPPLYSLEMASTALIREIAHFARLRLFSVQAVVLQVLRSVNQGQLISIRESRALFVTRAAVRAVGSCAPCLLQPLTALLEASAPYRAVAMDSERYDTITKKYE